MGDTNAVICIPQIFLDWGQWSGVEFTSQTPEQWVKVELVRQRSACRVLEAKNGGWSAGANGFALY